MSSKSVSSSCSSRCTESKNSSSLESIIGSKDSFRRTKIPSLSTTTSFDIVQSQFQDLMHLKNVLINKSKQQMNVKNYIEDQQKERLNKSINNTISSDHNSGKEDTDVYSPSEKETESNKTNDSNSPLGESTINIRYDKYETLIRELEAERMEHAKTKTKCEELADHLDFSRGQIEILQRQLQREKDHFRQILGSVQESNKVEDERKDQLETRVRELHEDNQQLVRRLRTKDSEIEKLQEALTKEKSSQNRRIIDMEVRRCQEDYISSLLTKTGRGRPNHAKKGYPTFPSHTSHRKTKLSS